MEPDLTRNHFELFGLTPSFEVDEETLALRFRDLQRIVHPDRFAHASDRERRIAVQQAACINEAFRVLKDPLARARYLLELQGFALDDTHTAMPPAFLMEQMELREALAEVRDKPDPFGALEAVREEIEGRERSLIMELQSLFAEGTRDALERAQESVRKLQFMNRLLEEASELEETLIHENG